MATTAGVYFVRSGDTGPIKIGFSRNVVARLREIGLYQPTPLQVLAVVPGNPADEIAMHRRFDAERLRGEWFAASERLLAYIATLDPWTPPLMRPTVSRGVPSGSAGALGSWMLRAGMSQEEFAARIDASCTQALVSKWARGVVLPSRERRAAIERLTDGKVTARGLLLRYKHMKAKGKARGALFRAKRGIE